MKRRQSILLLRCHLLHLGPLDGGGFGAEVFRRPDGTDLDELAGGAWDLADFGPNRLRAAASIVRNYRDVPIGVTDASLVVLAAEMRTDRIVTLDRRHFSALRLPGGGPIRILPD